MSVLSPLSIHTKSYEPYSPPQSTTNSTQSLLSPQLLQLLSLNTSYSQFIEQEIEEETTPLSIDNFNDTTPEPSDAYECFCATEHESSSIHNISSTLSSLNHSYETYEQHVLSSSTIPLSTISPFAHLLHLHATYTAYETYTHTSTVPLITVAPLESISTTIDTTVSSIIPSTVSPIYNSTSIKSDSSSNIDNWDLYNILGVCDLSNEYLTEGCISPSSCEEILCYQTKQPDVCIYSPACPCH